jgi:transcriptional regulator with XRE-family HTH domain
MMLREQRTVLALSVADVAAQLDVHPNTIWRWERRERLPGPAHIRGLARVLDLSPAKVVEFFDEARTCGTERHESLRGHGLRRLRKAAAMTAPQVAQAVGVPAHTVYNWEHGRARIPLRHVPGLAEVLNLDANPLVDVLVRAPVAPLSTRNDPSTVTGLRRLRRRAGLSQRIVAERLGVSRHSVGVWEAGGRPPLYAVRKLGRIYGVPVSTVAAAAGVVPPSELDPQTWKPGDLAPVLRVLRQWSGLTQQDIALACGCKQVTVRSWEAARSQPQPKFRARLETLFRLMPGSLIMLYASEPKPGSQALPQRRRLSRLDGRGQATLPAVRVSS